MKEKEMYSSIEIDRIAGGTDKNGYCAWAILKEEFYDAQEDGNKIDEKEIEMIRKDIYDRHISALSGTKSETLQIIDFSDTCINLEEELSELKAKIEWIRNSVENMKLSFDDLSPNEIKSYISRIEEECDI
jgi:hypothetical protein